jgi:hypothetical protein
VERKAYQPISSFKKGENHAKDAIATETKMGNKTEACFTRGRFVYIWHHHITCLFL